MTLSSKVKICFTVRRTKSFSSFLQRCFLFRTMIANMPIESKARAICLKVGCWLQMPISLTFLVEHIYKRHNVAWWQKFWITIVSLETKFNVINFDYWAATCDFQQCGINASVDSDEPMQPSFELRNTKWCSFSSLTLIEYSSD